MDRKQKIMRLIIDTLAENQDTEYIYTGSVMTVDPQVITLQFVAKKAHVYGDFNIWGIIDVPLFLKAQYDSRSALNDQPLMQGQIEKDLQEVSIRISRLL